MIKSKLKKGWIVVVISLLFGISIVPVINANINEILPTDNKNRDINEEFVEVTCQVSNLRGFKQVVKEISRDNLEKIINLANGLNFRLGEKDTVSTLQKKVTVLVIELKKAGLLPKGIVIENIVNTMVNNIIFKLNSPSFLSDNHSENRFSFIFGAGDNKTAFLAWRQNPIIFLRIRLWEILGLEDPYTMGPIIRMFLYKPKLFVLNGQWISYSTNATLISVGLNGINKIKDEGFGAYCLQTFGFIGFSIGSNVGGFICGFCLYSDIYFNPIE
ncbi:MAG: hypothetical protein JSU91_06845 [Thermoplasmatales archaeon]|nr:MAG: hypothetical protein JSU91_06845 [Thermoplasmatales archaeon]